MMMKKMKKPYRLLSLFIIAIISVIVIASCSNIGDPNAPVPGNSGTITISNIGTNSLTLTWTRATDDQTARENLEYLAYYATVSSIETPEDVEANGTPVGDWETDINTRDVTGLDEGTDYYFTVLVRDEDEATGLYEVVSQATLMTVTVTFQDVPVSGESIELEITGSGMSDLNESYQPDVTSVSINVPPGLSRTFTAVSETPSVTSRGETVADLLSTDDADVTVELEVYETKLVIPDTLNNRIVQIDDMQGTGWLEVDYTVFGIESWEFQITDIDFDSLGRIYLTNNYGSALASFEQMFRMDDITDTSPEIIIEGMTKGVVSLAIDRKSGYVYYSTDASSPNSIRRCDYDGENDVEFVTGTYGFWGLSVGEDGSVYAVNDMSDFIFFDKYDTNGSRVSRGETYLSNPLDSIVREPYVYLLNNGSFEVLRLDASDLSKDPSDTMGSQDDGSPPDDEEFFGPRHFVAVPNKKFTVIDEQEWAVKNRLASFDEDPLGGSWETYGESGSGTGQFSFFVNY
jgi:hypothetical protein